jgi:hypothetical protein
VGWGAKQKKEEEEEGKTKKGLLRLDLMIKSTVAKWIQDPRQVVSTIAQRTSCCSSSSCCCCPVSACRLL